MPNVSLTAFSGRIYLNFGDAGLAIPKNENGQPNTAYQPPSNDSHDTNYYTNWAYIELNVACSSSDNMDRSYIDFFSMAIEASTWLNGQQVGALTFVDSSPTVLGQGMASLAALTRNAAVVESGGSIVRILGPGLSSDYPDWNDYFDFLENEPQSKIAGYFGGSGGTGRRAAQNYSLTAQFNPPDRPNFVTLTGTANGGEIDIAISYADLNAPTGIYGCNPGYTVNGGPKTSGIVNDVTGEIVGDLLAALNYGLLASKTVVEGKTLGERTTSEMFKLGAQLLGQGKVSSMLFAAAQPDNSAYYNVYAAQILNMTTDAYGFPFADRIQQPLLPFPPGAVDYLKISILPIDYPG
jgi:hypothetical protein